MINFILNNPFIALMLGFLIIAVVGLLIIWSSGKKEKKQVAKKKKGAPKVEPLIKKEPPKDGTTTVGGLVRIEPEEPKPDYNEHLQTHISKRKRVKNFDKKKCKHFAKSKPYKFVRVEKRDNIPKYQVSAREKELLERMTFVKNGKKVATLAKREKMLKVPVPKEPEPEIIPVVEEVPAELTAEEKRQQKFAKYFDKSRRISKKINEDDLESLFDSHISDAYMNIDMNRHLNVGKDFTKSLFSRASRVLAHGEIKITDDADLTIKANRKEWLKKKSKEEYRKMMMEGHQFEDFLDEEIEKEEMMEDYIFQNYSDELDGEYIEVNMNLSPKNILMVDSVINRDRHRGRNSRMGKR